MLRRSKKSNRCFPPRRETSVHPPAWTLIGRQALWWVIMSRFLYQKESSLKYWIVIPQWEVDNDKLLPLIYLLALHSHTARRHSCITNCWQRWFHLGKCLDLCQTLADQGFAFNFSLKMGSTISFSLEAKDKSLASDSPGKTKKKASPSTLGRNARRKEAFLKKEAKPCTWSCVHWRRCWAWGRTAGLPKQGEDTSKCNICGNGFKSEAGVKIHNGRTHKNQELPEDY